MNLRTLTDFLHITVPAEIVEDVIVVPSFEIPVEEPNTDYYDPIVGTIAVELEPETKKPRVRVSLKKKAVKKAPAVKKKKAGGK